MSISSTQKKIIYGLLLVSVFVFGLNIPDVSQAIMFFASLIAVFLNYDKFLLPRFLLSVALLLSFLTVHYYLLFSYGFTTGRYVIQHSLLLLSSYLMGCSFGRKLIPKWPIDLLWVLLAMVAGFVFFTLSSSLLSDMDMYANHFGRANRTGISIWTAEVRGFGPMLGAQGSLGAVLLPVFVFGKDNRITPWHFFFVSIVILTLVVSGVWTNLLLINRSPFITMLLTFCISTIVYFKLKRKKMYFPQADIGRRGFLFSVMILGAVILYYYIVYINQDFSNLGIVSRFQLEGLSSIRYEIWRNALVATLSHPLGGRSMYIGHTYAHNLWLGIGINTGLFSMLLLIFFHISHLKDIMKILRTTLPNTIIFAILSILVAIITAFLVESMFASLTYFAMTFFFLGLIKSLSFDLDHQCG